MISIQNLNIAFKDDLHTNKSVVYNTHQELVVLQGRSKVLSDRQINNGPVSKYKKVVEDLSFVLLENQITGLIGESGSGKTLTALSLMGLLKIKFPSIKVSGKIEYQGLNLLQICDEDYLKIRGKQINIVFQNPFTFFNPSIRIQKQFEEVLGSLPISRISEVLNQVQLYEEKRILKSFPHQLSGGQLQRLMIALALLHHPKLLIADEPTTALDPTLKWGILHLLKELNVQKNLTLLLISHDLKAIGSISHQILVMYKGCLVEQGPAQKILNNPLHPYTQALMGVEKASHQKLQKVDSHNACPYTHLCPDVKSICTKKMPPVFIKEEQEVRCWLYGETNE